MLLDVVFSVCTFKDISVFEISLTGEQEDRVVSHFSFL